MPPKSVIQSQLKDHKDWLLELCQDPLMTVAKIQTKLHEKTGIKASQNQLHACLKTLGQRKYLSLHEWSTVLRALDSQKEFGRVWDVELSGNRFTDAQIRRKRKYAKYTDPIASCLEEADQLLKQLPDGITVKRRLPQHAPDGSEEPSTTPQPTRQDISRTEPDGVISMQLDSISANPNSVSVPGAVMPKTGAEPSSFDTQPASTPTANRAQFVLSPTNMRAYPAPVVGLPEGFDFLIQSPPFELNYDHEDLGMNCGEAQSFFGPNSWENYNLCGRLSPSIFPWGIQSPDSADPNSFSPARLRCASLVSGPHGHCNHPTGLIEHARLLAGGCRSVLSRTDRSTTHRVSPTAQELLDNLQSLVAIDIASTDSLESLGFIGGPASSNDGFLQLFLFSVVNNFAGTDRLPKNCIIHFINQHELVRSTILSQLGNEATAPFSIALAEKLMESAIEAGDAKTVHDLLALKIVRPDDLVYTTNGERRTAIEKAAGLRHLDVTACLLHFGADVNKTHKGAESWSEKGALECAIRLWGEYRPIDLNLVDLLLRNGATVSDKLAENAVPWGDARLIKMLISRLCPSQHEYFFEDILTNVAEHLKNEDGFEVARMVISACRDIHANECLDRRQEHVANAMAGAARRKNKELVELLLPHGGQGGIDVALTGAARSGCHSLVHQLIRHGACADGPGFRMDGDGFRTTPLAEAIRANDAELVELFAKEGAWNQIAEPDRLQAALQAIAVSGNSVCLSKILQSVPSPSPQALTLPLSTAIVARHEEIALRLVHAGADVNLTDPDPPLAAALRVQSKAITWAILESDVELRATAMEEATKWGDPEIIKALLFMGADINTFGYECPLSIAIKSGDRSLIDLFLNLGANPNLPPGSRWPGCCSPLAAAALVRDAETANYLLDHGADPADQQAFLNAITHDRMILNVILQHFRKQNPKGRKGFGGRVLHHALQTHDDELLERCLNAGIAGNAFAKSETFGIVTALGLAIKQDYDGCLDSISLILNAGGDPNMPTSRRPTRCHIAGDSVRRIVQQTALLDAIDTKNLPLVEFLIARGADVRKEAKLGLKRTPLQKACEVASHTIVDLLLTHNADVNEEPAALGGATALQLAAKAGSLRIAKRLLELGANGHAPGVRLGGRSAIEYAAEYGRLSMIPLLWNAPGANFPRDQIESAIALARENGHRACAVLLHNLSSGSQGLVDASSVADGGGRANVID